MWCPDQERHMLELSKCNCTNLWDANCLQTNCRFPLLNACGTAVRRVWIPDFRCAASISGSMRIIWIFLDRFQLIYYLLFVNIQYPLLLESFLKIFSKSQLNLFPSFLKEEPEAEMNLPSKFAELHRGCDLFNYISKPLLLILITVTVRQIFSYVIPKIPHLVTTLRVCTRILYLAESFVHQTLTSYMIELTFSSFLQMRCPMYSCLLYTSPSPRDGLLSRMPSSA
eukprot:TRINITY_DN32211_c0_g1_i1.p1 TRINITY_DN32211_c0_g1~~TRINITY_DN32211_c0_g1_i1.p1  ORF type:complete len:226 (+),score=24.56 TRINITY_DN32211_c0_g1_i1:295-972(+)